MPGKVLKVPLTPNFSLSHQNSPLCSDHSGENIIVIHFLVCDFSKFKKKGHCNSPLCNEYGLSLSVMYAGEVFRLERYTERAKRRQIRGHRGIGQRNKIYCIT